MNEAIEFLMMASGYNRKSERSEVGEGLIASVKRNLITHDPQPGPGLRRVAASLLGARASSLRQARESGATSTVRGHRCPRSRENRDLGKPTGPG